MKNNKKVTAFLSLGSNLDNPIYNIRYALQLIALIEKTELKNSSRLYTTSPVSPIVQKDFINAVCQVETFLDPIALFEKIEDIEKKIGKEKKRKIDPRKIDIDLLFFGQKVLQHKKLTLPHPEWKNRLFVLIPLSELTKEIQISYNERLSILSLIKNHKNPHGEKVRLTYEKTNSY